MEKFVKECIENGDVNFMFRAIYGNVRNVKDFTRYSLETRKFVIQQLLQTPTGTKLLQEYPFKVFNVRFCSSSLNVNNEYKRIEMEYICWMCWGLVPESKNDSIFDLEFQFENGDRKGPEKFREFLKGNDLKLPPLIADIFLKNLGNMHDSDGEGILSDRELFRKYIKEFTDQP